MRILQLIKFFEFQASNCYPFGWTLPDHNYSSTENRFGFQAQEEDPELWEGATNYKYRMHNPRTGRFFSVDPLDASYPWNSSYAFSENRVIDAIELEGAESTSTHKMYVRYKITKLRSTVNFDFMFTHLYKDAYVEALNDISNESTYAAQHLTEYSLNPTYRRSQIAKGPIGQAIATARRQMAMDTKLRTISSPGAYFRIKTGVEEYGIDYYERLIPDGAGLKSNSANAIVSFGRELRSPMTNKDVIFGYTGRGTKAVNHEILFLYEIKTTSSSSSSIGSFITAVDQLAIAGPWANDQGYYNKIIPVVVMDTEQWDNIYEELENYLMERDAFDWKENDVNSDARQNKMELFDQARRKLHQMGGGIQTEDGLTREANSKLDEFTNTK
ncbi:MAG: hypothetical protein MK212_20455 [Saprospiraceae bacterium]|nr:hypothetical protein [Saprospiraceae bacterium]